MMTYDERGFGSVSKMIPEQKKAFYLDLVRSWENESYESIARRWNITPHGVSSAATALRKKGIPLSRINPTSINIFEDDFIEELKSQYKPNLEKLRLLLG